MSDLIPKVDDATIQRLIDRDYVAVVADRAANGCRKTAGFPPAGTLAREVGQSPAVKTAAGR